MTSDDVGITVFTVALLAIIAAGFFLPVSWWPRRRRSHRATIEPVRPWPQPNGHPYHAPAEPETPEQRMDRLEARVESLTGAVMVLQSRERERPPAAPVTPGPVRGTR